MLLSAVGAADPGGVTDVLLNQGPIGALAVAIGWVGWTGWKRERDRADSERSRADAERAAKDALTREFFDKVIPALLESTRATRDLVDYSRSERR